jgi:Ca2+-dependent lipid-binding protein
MYRYHSNRDKFLNEWIQSQTRNDFTEPFSGIDSVNAYLSNTNESLDRRIASSKLSFLYNHCGWMLNPFFFATLSVLPYILFILFGTEIYKSLLLIGFIYGYLYIIKSHHDQWTSHAIISDNKMLQLVLEHLPGYVIDTDKEQCRWVNSALEQSWYALAEYGEIKAKSEINPIMDRLKPSFLTGLAIDKLSMGTIPPVIISMRTLSPVMNSKKKVINTVIPIL